MKFLLQRVEKASVKVDDKTVGKINNGIVVLVGIGSEDTIQTADYLIKKLVNLRIFKDCNDKMNLNINQVNGELLVISQFTLYGDCCDGNRPFFGNAAPPDIAENLYNYIINELRKRVRIVETGIFGAHMKVNLINDGPVTIMLEK